MQFCDMSHANWAWDSATVMAKCYRVYNAQNFLHLEPVVAPVAAPNAVKFPKTEVEGRFEGTGAPTSGFVHGSPRLKASIQSLIPAESTVST